MASWMYLRKMVRYTNLKHENSLTLNNKRMDCLKDRGSEMGTYTRNRNIYIKM